MNINRMTEMAQLMTLSGLNAGDVAVDATCGNGHDTLFLAQHFKKVYAFDIQSAAVMKTKKKLQTQSIHHVSCIHADHQTIKDYISEEVAAVIFNFGYLPGSDRRITTIAKSSLNAVQNVLPLLAKDGVCVLVIYPAHEAGQKESDVLLNFATQLPNNEYRVVHFSILNQDNDPPFIIAITKKG